MADKFPFRVVMPLEFAGMEGGAPQMVELLIRHLVPRGLVPDVLCPDNDVAQAMAAAGARVTVTRGPKTWSLTPRRPAEIAAALPAVLPALRKMIDPSTIVHAQELHGQILTWLALTGKSTPNIFTYCRNEPEGFKFTLLRLAMQNCIRIVTTTEYQVGVLVKQMAARADRIAVIPNATDLHRQKSDGSPLRREIGLADDDFVYGVFGFYRPGKNQELLLRAASAVLQEVPQARFIFAGQEVDEGGAPYLPYLRDLCDRLGIADKVRLLPFERDKVRLFTGVDVVVSTSLGEGFGMSIIEAMALRRPVVAGCAGGPECIIRHMQTGILVPKNDPSALAQALIQLATDRKLYSSLQEAGLKEVKERFDPEVQARAYLDLYRAVAERRG